MYRLLTKLWNTPTIESVYNWSEDGAPFGRLNSMNVFNASGYEILIQRPDLLNPQDDDVNRILAQDFTLDQGTLVLW
jgi:hypothetical protein